jgi:hypothetical protein
MRQCCPFRLQRLQVGEHLSFCSCANLQGTALVTLHLKFSLAHLLCRHSETCGPEVVHIVKQGLGVRLFFRQRRNILDVSCVAYQPSAIVSQEDPAADQPKNEGREAIVGASPT